MNKTIQRPADSSKPFAHRLWETVQTINNGSDIAKKVLNDLPAKTEKTSLDSGRNLKRKPNAGRSRILQNQFRAGDKNARNGFQNLLLNLLFTCQRASVRRR